MGRQQRPNTTNQITTYTQNAPAADETTPLLKGPAGSSRGVVVTIGEVSSCQVDEEAARCASPLVDKVPTLERPRNVAGVIAILLLGM